MSEPIYILDVSKWPKYELGHGYAGVNRADYPTLRSPALDSSKDAVLTLSLFDRLMPPALLKKVLMVKCFTKEEKKKLMQKTKAELIKELEYARAVAKDAGEQLERRAKEVAELEATNKRLEQQFSGLNNRIFELQQRQAIPDAVIKELRLVIRTMAEAMAGNNRDE